METNSILEEIQDLVKDFIESTNIPEENRLDIWVTPENLKKVVNIIVENRWGYLMTITGLDAPTEPREEGAEEQHSKLEALYHFANEAFVLTIRVKVPYGDPRIDSICDLIPSATIYEREAIELFGFDLVGTPSTDRLVLPDSWPEGVYPMRKSFTTINQDQLEKMEVGNE